ncbi:MAG: hypothetical protein HY331_14050 [Chloroflexi bacterium]|nr:hypothetical protein [Chloroflexota bacterium]
MAIDRCLAYFGSPAPRQFDAALRAMQAAGTTSVVLTCSEHTARYDRAYLSRAAARARAEGLRVWFDPWGVAGLFGGEAFSAFLAERPDCRQVLSDGQPVTRACPSHPDVRAFVRDWIAGAAELGAEAIFWDEPQWWLARWTDRSDSRWACRCPACRAHYAALMGEPMPAAPVPGFQRAALVAFLREMTATAAAHGLPSAVCVLPFEEAALPGPADLLDLPGLIALAVDPYPSFCLAEPAEQIIRRLVALCRATNGRIGAQVWVQGFRLRRSEEASMEVSILEAARLGADSVAVWGYRGSVDLAALACERPEAVWRRTARAFRLLATGTVTAAFPSGIEQRTAGSPLAPREVVE